VIQRVVLLTSITDLPITGSSRRSFFNSFTLIAFAGSSEISQAGDGRHGKALHAEET
jgi:hypothetical protein